MGKKLAVLFIMVIVLSGLSGFFVVGGLQAYARFKSGLVSETEHCGGQSPVNICVHTPASVFSAFYPSYVATQSHLFSVDYSSATPLTLFINVGIPGSSETLTQTVNANATKQTINFVPPLLPNTLRNLTSDEMTSLHVQVTDTSKRLYYVNDTPFLLHSRWLMQWLYANRLEIAAWVTPDDPAVSALVKKAATHLATEQPPTPAMIGYSKASSKEVMAQVDAIYDTLRLDYHMHYLQASVPYNGPGSNSATENIKLPFEVLQQQSGMCIELTTLLASAVEHIGLHAEIVIVNGHAFLGVAVTPDDSHFEYWDPAEINNNVAGESANIDTDTTYQRDASQHSIVDTIVISDARNMNIQAML